MFRFLPTPQRSHGSANVWSPSGSVAARVDSLTHRRRRLQGMRATLGREVSPPVEWARSDLSASPNFLRELARVYQELDYSFQSRCSPQLSELIGFSCEFTESLPFNGLSVAVEPPWMQHR